MNNDVIIVGAGAAGLMTAIELANEGLAVQVFDAGAAGMESSWAGGGILSPIYPWRYPDPVNTLAQWSTAHYPEYLSMLKTESGIDPQLLVSGHLILQTDLSTAAVQNWARTFPMELYQLDRQDLMEIEPSLNPDFDHGLWLPDIGQVRNPRLVQALKATAEKKGITIHENTPVEQITSQDKKVTGITTRTGDIPAETVLVAAGAWSGEFQLGNTRPEVHPIKGQMIQFETRPGTIRRITLYEGRYVIPRKDGKVVVGSTLEHNGYDKSIDEPTRQKLHEISAEIHPVLKDAPIINHWAGLRPGNERQTPFIGPHPEINRLYFNTGHYRNGIVTGLASARLCADLITGSAPVLSPEPFALH